MDQANEPTPVPETVPAAPTTTPGDQPVGQPTSEAQSAPPPRQRPDWMRPPITEQQRQTMLDLHRQGLRAAEIAQRVGLSTVSVYRVTRSVRAPAADPARVLARVRAHVGGGRTASPEQQRRRLAAVLGLLMDRLESAGDDPAKIVLVREAATAAGALARAAATLHGWGADRRAPSRSEEHQVSDGADDILEASRLAKACQG